uniref:Uncharacterized protein n=1 Tax=Anopheles darlingi TaxID=43151 RepID=A0A2M4CWE6_ANODA
MQSSSSTWRRRTMRRVLSLGTTIFCRCRSIVRRKRSPRSAPVPSSSAKWPISSIAICTIGWYTLRTRATRIRSSIMVTVGCLTFFSTTKHPACALSTSSWPDTHRLRSIFHFLYTPALVRRYVRLTIRNCWMLTTVGLLR